MRVRSGVLVLAMLLGGCSSAALSEQSAGGADDPLKGADLSGVSAAQAEEIGDRAATADEYQAAFQRYRVCLNAAGLELKNVKFTNHVYEFGVPNEAIEDGADTKCYRAEFEYIDILWQTSDIVENASESAQIARECLQERGIEPRDSMKGMTEQLEDAGLEPSECL